MAVELGDVRGWGETTCQFGLTRPMCDRPATWHTKWAVDDFVSNACDEHLEYIRSKGVEGQEYLVHPFSEACNQAGTFWFTPDDPEVPGYCFFGAVPSTRQPEAVESWLEHESE